VAEFETLLARRAAREPVSRILGRREFYGRSFLVTGDVLDPRPDTETLVEAALRLMPASAGILDLGTGSGAIIVTLLAERAAATGVGLDISEAALAVARANARAHGVLDRLDLRHSDWFDGITGRFDLMVANPPYIPAAEIAGLERDVRDHDPLLALAGGPDGLAAYRRIAAGAGRHLAARALLLLEIGTGQADAVTVILRAAGFEPEGRFRDLAGHVRCLGFRGP
jgi:release factor glutamine methyltransferase